MTYPFGPATDQGEGDGHPTAERPLVERGHDAELLSARLVTSRHRGQLVSVAVLLVLFAMLVHTVVTNPRFQWGVVGDYFFHGLDLHEGEATVLLGPSGSGKSTLLRCVNHLEKPDAGFVVNPATTF